MSLLPPVCRRVIVGLLGRSPVLVGELPEARRPGNLAILEGRNRDLSLGAEVAILSYNVKRAERIDEVSESLVSAVGRHRPELVLLQEAPPELIEHAEPAFRGRRIFFAPFHQVASPDRRYRFHAYGQIIASTVPLLRPEVFELPTVNPATLGTGHTLKRIALHVELPAPDGRRVGLANVHNEPFTFPKRRLHQYTALLERLAERDPAVEVICGDFNPTLGRRSEPGFRLLESLGYENALRSTRTLDTCFAAGHRDILTAERLDLRGSDHRPILVRILV